MKHPGTYTKEGFVNVIIETPYKSRNKFKFEPKLGLYRLTKVIPSGLEFPCDMGFIPGTKGQDGDPLDALILMDELTYPGCLVECRVVGVLKAKQKEKGKRIERNDRFICVPAEMVEYDHLRKIKDLNQHKLQSIAEFFKEYNKKEGKKFTLEKISGTGEAHRLIKSQLLKKK